MGYDEDNDYGYGHADAPQKPGGISVIMVVLIVIGVSFGACAVISVIAAIAIPNLLSARKSGNESASIGGLKAIYNAQTLFREGDAEKDGIFDYGSLDELAQVGYVDKVLGSGAKQGFIFEVTVDPENPEFQWWAVARPAVPGTTGDRFFYTDQSGVILFSTEDVITPPIDTEQPLPPGVMLLGGR